MSWWKRVRGGKNKAADRDRATALVTEGYVLAHHHKWEEALEKYQRAADVDDSLAVAHLNVGLCLLDLRQRDRATLHESAQVGMLDKARAALVRAVSVDDTLVRAWRALAQLDETRGAWVEADDAWARVAALAAADDGAGSADDAASAAVGQARVAARARAERARRRALAALATSATRDDDEARAALDALEALLPDDVDDGIIARGHAIAGALARRLGDNERARLSLQRAVGVDATDVDAWRDLAAVQAQLGDLPAALRASMQAFRARPTDAGIVCNVGVCHLALQEWDKAHEFITLAARLEPKDEIVVRALAALKAARPA